MTISFLILITHSTKDLNETNNLQLSQTEEKSRRFSKLPPAAKNNPNAAKVGHFAITKTPEMSAESEPIHGKNILDINTKKYKFDARNLYEETILQSNDGILKAA